MGSDIPERYLAAWYDINNRAYWLHYPDLSEAAKLGEGNLAIVFSEKFGVELIGTMGRVGSAAASKHGNDTSMEETQTTYLLQQQNARQNYTRTAQG